MLIVVAAALIDSAGRILVQQRPENTHLAGLWEFPGGKIESGETPEAALVRELQEELGVAVAQDDLTPLTFASEVLEHHGSNKRHLLLLLYICKRWESEPVAHHAAALAWHTVDTLGTLDMPPADRPFIEMLLRQG